MKYTDEQFNTIKDAYLGASTDAERKAVMQNLAKQFNVSEHSIRGKLVANKIYVKPAATTKTGAPVTAKKEYVDAISVLLGLPDLESLEKVTKRDLQRISERLIAMSEQVNLKVQ